MKGVIILFVILLFLNIVGGGFLFETHRNLADCNNRESFKCPTFSCSVIDSKCGSAPYRCIALDTGSSDCTGDNKVCMTYDITDQLGYTPAS